MLRMHFFGQVRVYRDDNYLDKFPTRKAQLLFCYLVWHREQCHSRNVLTGLFWQDSPEEQARKSLRTTLWRLKKLLGADPNPEQPCLLVDNDDICFNTESDYWLDVEEFEKNLSQLPPHAMTEGDSHPDEQTLHALTKAVELYQGDFMQGCYEDWCLFERERLQGLFLDALIRLMDHHRKQGTYEEAIRYGLRVLSYDPLLEQVHREVMRLHCLAGNRAAAMRQYHLCEAVLAKELGIEPMKETIELYAQIRHSARTPEPGHGAQDHRPSTGKPGSKKTTLPLASHMDDALNELKLAQAGFQHLSARFQRAVQVLEDIRQNF